MRCYYGRVDGQLDDCGRLGVNDCQCLNVLEVKIKELVNFEILGSSLFPLKNLKTRELDNR